MNCIVYEKNPKKNPEITDTTQMKDLALFARTGSNLEFPLWRFTYNGEVFPVAHIDVERWLMDEDENLNFPEADEIDSQIVYYAHPDEYAIDVFKSIMSGIL